MPITSPALETLGQIMTRLRGITPPTHPQFFATRQAGYGQNSQTITYVPWSKAKLALDECAPGWDYAIKEVGSVTGNIPEVRDGQGNIRKLGKPNHSRVFVVAAITVPTCEGAVTREAVGYEDFDNDTYGDPFSNASSMALRRCATMFDLAIDLYDKSGGQQQYPAPQGGSPAPNGGGGGAPGTGAVAKHGKYKDMPLDSPTIELSWLDYMSGPKAERINEADKAMYRAELQRRQGGGAVGAASGNPPPANYAPSATNGPATASPSNGGTNGTRSNDEIKNLVQMCGQAGVNWEGIVSRARSEFGQDPKLLTLGEFGLLQILITKNKTKQDALAVAAQHIAGNPDPKTWGPNELSLLTAMVS